MSWLEKLLPPKIQQTDPSERRQIPGGLWIKCPSCETVLYKTDLEQNLNVCPKCSHHHRIGAEPGGILQRQRDPDADQPPRWRRLRSLCALLRAAPVAADAGAGFFDFRDRKGKIALQYFGAHSVALGAASRSMVPTRSSNSL